MTAAGRGAMFVAPVPMDGAGINKETSMRKTTFAIFTLTAIVSAGVLFGGPAAAWTQRRGGYACNGGSASNWGMEGRNTSTSLSLVVGCAIDSDSDKSHTAITHLNVHVDNPGGILATAVRCVRFFNASGGACGSNSSSSSAGTITLTPPNSPSAFATQWNAGVHFPGVVVTLPAQAAIKGYYTDNL